MEQQLRSFAGKGSTGAFCRYRIEDRSFFSIIKKDIRQEAETVGFSAKKIGKIQIVVAELVSNLLKFGERNREFLWKTLSYRGELGIEMLALDKGAGIRSVSQAMEDGFSTSGTAGEGLGAISRQSDYFELYSQPEQGTVVLSRFFVKEKLPFSAGPLSYTGFSLPKPGETVCGDGYLIEYQPENELFNLLVMDGLGHGPGAHEASMAGISAYAGFSETTPCEILKGIHQKIKSTRGVVAMALKYHFKEEKLSYCGIGNISGKTFSFKTLKAFFSYNGIVGHVMSSRIQDQEVAWEKGNLLVLHSDGLNSRWDITKYFQIQRYDPAILAACLYRDFSRGNDDTTIVISKHPSIDE